MNPNPSFIKRYPQAIFWAIAWATSFFGYYMSVLYPSGSASTKSCALALFAASMISAWLASGFP